MNDYIPSFIAKRIVQGLIEQDKNPGKSRVLVMGVTFKEDVADIRNSKVVDLVKELEDYSIAVDVVDPYGSPSELLTHYGIRLQEQPVPGAYDGVVLAVGHQVYRAMRPADFEQLAHDQLYLFDIKGVLDAKEFDNYWRL